MAKIATKNRNHASRSPGMIRRTAVPQ